MANPVQPQPIHIAEVVEAFHAPQPPPNAEEPAPHADDLIPPNQHELDQVARAARPQQQPVKAIPAPMPQVSCNSCR